MTNVLKLKLDTEELSEYVDRFNPTVTPCFNLNNGILFEYLSYMDIVLFNIDVMNVGALYEFYCNGGEYCITLNYEDIYQLLNGKTLDVETWEIDWNYIDNCEF